MGSERDDGRIRLAAVAGQFYPKREDELSRVLDKMLSACAQAGTAKVRALISPHAGYVYSGMTAAKGFSLVKGQSYDRVLVIAPSHQMYLEGLALSGHKAFRTPLGDIQVDRAAVEDIADSGAKCIDVIPRAHDAEHSLEVQLPFIQKTLPGTPILPLVCGSLSQQTELEASRVLSCFWNPQTLWVISSDFTHFGSSFGYVPFREEVEKNLKDLDMGAADTILALDGKAFSEYLDKTGATICGANPIRLLLRTIEQTKSNVKTQLIAYTNSGELSGDFSHCVGYCSIAVTD
ncbi:MAG: AmmeMemoRadiSam system protein B [Victivallales bacterium]|nr:AmmeMemoRadiSam system protein B [Victivallales bacterium]